MAKTVRFLAPGTRLVVRNTRWAAPRWHETSKEIVIDVEPESHVCPITGQRVHGFIHEGYWIYFPPAIVRTREVFEEGDVNEDIINSFRPVLFTYDIPDRAVYIDRNGRERPFYNPSDRLRQFAVRLNLSCWVLGEGDVPHALIARMLDAGCDPYVCKFDPTEARKLVGMAVGKLRKEVNNAITRADESRARANNQLENAVNEEGVTAEEAEERYLERANAIQTRLQALTTDLNKVAERFGIGANVLNIDRLSNTGDALKVEMEVRARAYMEGINRLRATGTETGEVIANAMEASTDGTLTLAASDLLEEAGDEEGAKKLRAFAGMETPEPVDVPDDGVFSLVADDAQYEDEVK